MRLAWATPFNVKSAIAIYSREVCHELSRRGINVEILRIEEPEGEAIDALATSLTVHSASLQPSAEFLQDYDAIVVNVGDYTQFHLGALRLISMVPVISIIHDSNLQNFVHGAVERGLYLDELVKRLPGNDGIADGINPQPAELALFATMSCACVAHGPHYVDLLRMACPGPVAVLPLCYPDLGAVTPKPGKEGSFVITTFGMINSNKQPERVMRAIASSPTLKDKAVYRLAGAIEDGKRMYYEALAKELGIRPPEIYGRVSDEKLFELLSASDVLCCLRYPVSEGGSASLITALYSARPIVVPNFGSYADVPDDLVWKVSYGENEQDLTAVLLDIEGDRAAAEHRSHLMKSWAQTTYSAQNYVDKLLPLVDLAIEATPKVDAGRKIGRLLAALDIGPSDPVVERTEYHIKHLFGPSRGLQ
ncbi:MAG: glycosyltransferase [Tardiphaga sp.]|nr:glycosyltransferase [Tardiphaga sp.]